LSRLFHRASRACGRKAKGDISRPGRRRSQRRRGARFRDGLLDAAEVADAAPATALRPKGPCCARLRRCPDCPVAAVRRRRARWLLRHGWSSLPRRASVARDSSDPVTRGARAAASARSATHKSRAPFANSPAASTPQSRSCVSSPLHKRAPGRLQREKESCDSERGAAEIARPRKTRSRRGLRQQRRRA